MKSKKLLICLLVVLSSNFSWAQEDDYENYDTIVGQLSTTRSSQNISYDNDPLANVRLHAGVGMAMSMTTLQRENGSDTSLFQGVEVNFGIDLFSPIWMAEGTYRNLGRAEIETDNSVDFAELNEFDLKLVYRPYINRLLRFKTTGGLAARYMTYFDNVNNQRLNYNTPAWLASLGLEARITRTFAFTAEIAYRSSLIEDTIDDNAVGAS